LHTTACCESLSTFSTPCSTSRCIAASSHLLQRARAAYSALRTATGAWRGFGCAHELNCMSVMGLWLQRVKPSLGSKSWSGAREPPGRCRIPHHAPASARQGASRRARTAEPLGGGPVCQQDGRGAHAQQRQVGHKVQVVAGGHAVRDRLARHHQRHAPGARLRAQPAPPLHAPLLPAMQVPSTLTEVG